MTGNVWEWCQDWYSSYNRSAQTNPTGAATGSTRVFRGDNWRGEARGCRVSRRVSNTPNICTKGLGLRLAL